MESIAEYQGYTYEGWGRGNNGGGRCGEGEESGLGMKLMDLDRR